MKYAGTWLTTTVIAAAIAYGITFHVSCYKLPGFYQVCFVY